jgi:cyclic pyranopterin phosphate synthase
MLVDSRQRTITHVRISVTDRCQLRCLYCLPEEGVPLLDRREVLSYEEILAFAAGFDPVKINVVLLRGVNDDPGPYLDLTRRVPVEVRFIEYMPIGPVPSERWFVSAAEFRSRLEAHGPFEEAARSPGHGPAERTLRLPGAPGSFGFIPAVSDHFCDRCNRLRLTSDGHLRLCLFHVREIDLKPALRPAPDRERLRSLLREAIAEKPAGRLEGAADPGRGMSQIGG